MAVERPICAKLSLKKGREKSIEIVAALNEASDGDANISLPAGVNDCVGSGTDPVSMSDVCEPTPGATVDTPQQNRRYLYEEPTTPIRQISRSTDQQ
jgi:hypothetical protein